MINKQSKDEIIVYVGEGLNGAPVLARADVWYRDGRFRLRYRCYQLDVR